MLTIKTDAPAALLKKFEDAIAGKSEKEITTWRKVASGENAGKFTHTSERQKDLGFFKATVIDEEDVKEIRFRITWAKPTPDNTVYLYAYYHGHLMETFLHHFEDDFSTTVATAKAQK